MDDIEDKRVSALKGCYVPGHFGDNPESNIIFCELKHLMLNQVAFWPETFAAIETQLARVVGIASIPKPGNSTTAGDRALLRIEPLKIWVIGANLPLIENNEGVTLDLSHSRTHLRISGRDTTNLLNSFLPIDLREPSFPVGSVVSTVFHHVGVTMWRTEDGYQLFMPRGFAASLWELLLEGAIQFGCDVI